MARRVAFNLDDHQAQLAAKLGLDLRALARAGVERAIRTELSQRDRTIYANAREGPATHADASWVTAEVWGDG